MRILLWIGVLALLGSLGCIDTNAVSCADGRTCPAQTECDELHGRCVLPEQFETCKALDDGNACTIQDAPIGVCKDHVCLEAGCGDGFVVAPEQCDGPIADTMDDCTEQGFHQGGKVTCTSQCTFDKSQCSQYCGDGARNGDELCDKADLGGLDCTDFGFQSAAGLACSSACTFDVKACTGFCGDGQKNGAEQCDTSDLGTVVDCRDLGYYAAGTVTCTAGCTFNRSQCTQYCGDGAINGVEDCDGTALGGKTCLDFGYYSATTLACSDACTFDVSACQGYCGDGVINGAEDCEPAHGATPEDLGGATCLTLGFYNQSGLACGNGCRFDTSTCTGYCGDRTPNGSEVCDGKLPGTGNCTDFGFEGGQVSCSSGCGPDFAACHARGWTTVPAGFNQAVRASYVASPNDVFLGGDDGVRHFNGTTWTSAPIIIQVYGLWGSSGSDVWAVGTNGAIRHYNGVGWSIVSSGTTANLTAVWGAAANDIYAVGDDVVTHFDGTSWTATTLFGSFKSVWGSSANNVYAVGLGGAAQRWNGSAWVSASTGATWNIWGVWGSGPSDVFVVGSDYSGVGQIRHFDGASWTSQTTSVFSPLFAIWGTGPQDVYAVGNGGLVRHYDGASWSEQNSTTSAQLFMVGGSGPSDVYIGGLLQQLNPDTVRHLDGNAWSSMSVTSQAINSFFALDRNTIYAAGMAGTLLKSSGRRWTTIDVAGVTSQFNGVWAGSANDVYVVGHADTAWHYNGLTWSNLMLASGTNLLGVWGSGSKVFIAGQDGSVFRYDGLTWTRDSLGTLPWYGIWGASANDVYVVGLGGARHWDGTTWTTLYAGSRTAIWGSGPNDVYVVGSGYPLQHWNGSAWSSVTISATTPVTVSAIAGTGPADVTAFGGSEAWHFDGFGWSRQAMPLFTNVRAVGGGDDLFAGGMTPITMLWRPRACAASETACGDGRDEDCDGRYDCNDSDCAATSGCTSGGMCAGATTLSCTAQTTSVNGTTLGGGTNLDRYACDTFLELGRERIYKYTASASGTVSLQLTNAGQDLDLIVLEATAQGACDPRSTGCVAASSTSGTDSLTFSAVSGRTYFVVVDGFGGDAGAFSLSVTCP